MSERTTERIFVSGIGAVTPLGLGVPALWEGLVEGRSGIRRLTRIDTSDLPVGIGGEVPDELESCPGGDARAWRNLDRASRFAVIGTLEALRDASLPEENLGDRVAVVLGAGLSGMETLQQQTERLLELGPERVNPFTIPTLMPNASPANVCLAFGITGASYTVSTACASSAQAIVDACEMIRRGDADVVVTGGTESSLTRLGIASFCRMRAMPVGFEERPKAACKPFDLHRGGLVMSEGAGILVLESESSLRRRGARPRAEIVGHGATTDAHHIVQPAPSAENAVRAMRQAFDRAGVSVPSAAARTYVNAHGTGTKMNDALETKALEKTFGERLPDVPVSSTKSAVGHLIGAAGGVEAVVCTRALETATLPPTINFETPDPECEVDCVPNVARPSEIEFALSNSFAFGGHNVCLLFRRCADDD